MTDIQVFVRWTLIRLLKSVWTSTEKRRLFKRKRNQRINDIYGEDDSGHFRRIFMNGQVNCHIFTGKFCITVDFDIVHRVDYK